MAQIDLPPDFLLGANGFAGVTKVQLRGYNPAITNTPETVWQSSSVYAKLTTAVAMEAVSSSANDTAAGTGAKTIQVKGLNGSYEEFTETVTLNGTTPVALTNTACLAVNEIKILTVGSGGTNAGNIDVRVISGSAVKRRVGFNVVNVGQDTEFLYTIPANHVGLLKSVNYGGYNITGNMAVFLATTDVDGVYRAGVGADGASLGGSSLNNAKGRIDLGCGLIIPAKTLIELRAVTGAGGGEFWATAELFLINQSSPIYGALGSRSYL